jgi:hypothetical protein
MKKKYVHKQIETGIYLADSLEEVIDFLKTKHEELTKEGWVNLTLIEDDCGYPSSHHILCGKRLETDKEYERRIKKERKERQKKQQAKKEKEEIEKKRLEELIKKYGVPENVN